MQIPDHLRELRTDRRGRPVPYVNRWGIEATDRYAVRFDPVVVGSAVFYDDDPAGEPDFTRQSLQRQRECMSRRMCQVCTRRVGWGEGLLPLSTISTEVIQLGRQRIPVVTEPWLCPDCAVFATRVCPALIRRHSAEDLVLVRPEAESQVRLVLSSGWIDGPYKRATKARPAAMWCKAQLLVPGLLAAG